VRKLLGAGSMMMVVGIEGDGKGAAEIATEDTVVQ
jgi:hypothetical protein